FECGALPSKRGDALHGRTSPCGRRPAPGSPGAALLSPASASLPLGGAGLDPGAPPAATVGSAAILVNFAIATQRQMGSDGLFCPKCGLCEFSPREPASSPITTKPMMRKWT